MVEKLFCEETICENEVYRDVSAQVVETLDLLTAQLREEDKRLLQRLCDHYCKREEIVRDLAYHEGLRVAVGILNDIEKLRT